MKAIKYLFVTGLIALTSCADLDLNPLSEGSSENWYADKTEIEMALNDLYRQYVWNLEVNYETDRWTDDWAQRLVVYDYAAGAITSEWSKSETTWLNTYKGITRANRVIENLPEVESILGEEVANRLRAEACFFRACFYARLITLYGDVPFYTETISIEEAFAMGRTDKAQILRQVYADFDYAVENLPLENSSANLKRVGKGAAIAMKARAALWLSDWATVKTETRKCMDLGVYELFPDYEAYFKSKKIEKETIFSLPRSKELGVVWSTTNFMPRTPGGNAVAQPSWELLCIYPCTDGKLIDETPLFNSKNPFLNRDPRCTATFVAFGSEFLGYIYHAHPDSLQVLNTVTGKKVKNNDTKVNTTHASYNGMALRKFADQNWVDGKEADNPIIIMRYADILLMYAEAKIELNEIDQTVLDALNKVRARAYKADYQNITAYPAITTTDKDELRQIMRIERRIELVWENRRFWDLQRWKLFEKALERPYYGLLPDAQLKPKLADTDAWFWPITPTIDENGIPNLDALYEGGYIAIKGLRDFHSKQYLWPIPNKERLINPNITQNPEY